MIKNLYQTKRKSQTYLMITLLILVVDLAQNIQNAGAMPHKEFLANSNFSGYNFEFHSIIENDVIDIINGFASKSSCGYYNISLKLLKDAKTVLSKPISVITNQMFSTGIFPDKFKLAKVHTHVCVYVYVSVFMYVCMYAYVYYYFCYYNSFFFKCGNLCNYPHYSMCIYNKFHHFFIL